MESEFSSGNESEKFNGHLSDEDSDVENKLLFADDKDEFDRKTTSVFKKMKKIDAFCIFCTLTLMFGLGFLSHTIFETSEDGNEREYINILPNEHEKYDDTEDNVVLDPTSTETVEEFNGADETQTTEDNVIIDPTSSETVEKLAYSGFRDLDDSFISKFKEIIDEKNLLISEANQDLKDNDPENGTLWNIIHTKSCGLIDENINPKLNKLYKKHSMRNSSLIFTSNWSELVDKEKNKGILGFNIEEVLKLLKEQRQSLVRYYEVTTEEEFSKVFDNLKPHKGTKEYNDNLDSLSDLWATRIVNKQTFTIAILGSSVMSGMDNCWDLSYPPLLQRTYDKIFSVFNNEDIRVEVKPAGQNGDGAGTHAQMNCAWNIFSEYDILQLGYWMIPVTSIDQELLFRRSIALGRHVHSLNGLKFKSSLESYYSNGVLQLGNWEEPFYNDNFPWWPKKKKHWGRQGNGRCKLKTREGADGTLYKFFCFIIF